MSKTEEKARAARLAGLEYQFVGAIGALASLADAVADARRDLPKGKALRARATVITLQEHLQNVLAEIDQPITRLVLMAEGA